MTFWDILMGIDVVIFVVVALTVLYMLVFTIASLFFRPGAIPKAKRQNRFIILIPAYKSGRNVEQTVLSALGQTYPQRMFDVTVIADSLDEMTNFHLAQQPITLLTPRFDKSSKVKSLQLAVNNLPQFKIYDIAVVLDAGNIVDADFLEQLNDAFEAAGTKAVQTHRLSRNRDTVSARMDAVFEEINNSIFRRGHIVLGLSAATASSGIAYDFQWFKHNLMDLTSSREDKELEARMMRQHIYVDYFDSILVFDEKTRRADDFNRQRGRWILTQLGTLVRNIHFLPGAIVNRQYNMIDKILQWMLVPRMIMMSVIIFMSILMPFVYFSLCIKWWVLFALTLFVFALATPDYLVDNTWDKTFFKAPFVLMQSVPGLSRLVDKLRANKHFSDL